MLYIILNDGETYTAVKGSIIFDSVTQKMYTIRRSKQIKAFSRSNRWVKGINEIIDSELEDSKENNVDLVKGCLDDKGVVKPMNLQTDDPRNNDEDDGILGK